MKLLAWASCLLVMAVAASAQPVFQRNFVIQGRAPYFSNVWCAPLVDKDGTRLADVCLEVLDDAGQLNVTVDTVDGWEFRGKRKDIRAWFGNTPDMLPTCGRGKGKPRGAVKSDQFPFQHDSVASDTSISMLLSPDLLTSFNCSTKDAGAWDLYFALRAELQAVGSSKVVHVYLNGSHVEKDDYPGKYWGAMTAHVSLDCSCSPVTTTVNNVIVTYNCNLGIYENSTLFGSQIDTRLYAVQTTPLDCCDYVNDPSTCRPKKGQTGPICTYNTPDLVGNLCAGTPGWGKNDNNAGDTTGCGPLVAPGTTVDEDPYSGSFLIDGIAGGTKTGPIYCEITNEVPSCDTQRMFQCGTYEIAYNVTRPLRGRCDWSEQLHGWTRVLVRPEIDGFRNPGGEPLGYGHTLMYTRVDVQGPMRADQVTPKSFMASQAQDYWARPEGETGVDSDYVELGYPSIGWHLDQPDITAVGGDYVKCFDPYGPYKPKQDGPLPQWHDCLNPNSECRDSGVGMKCWDTVTDDWEMSPAIRGARLICGPTSASVLSAEAYEEAIVNRHALWIRPQVTDTCTNASHYCSMSPNAAGGVDWVCFDPSGAADGGAAPALDDNNNTIPCSVEPVLVDEPKFTLHVRAYYAGYKPGQCEGVNGQVINWGDLTSIDYSTVVPGASATSSANISAMVALATVCSVLVVALLVMGRRNRRLAHQNVEVQKQADSIQLSQVTRKSLTELTSDIANSERV